VTESPVIQEADPTTLKDAHYSIIAEHIQFPSPCPVKNRDSNHF